MFIQTQTHTDTDTNPHIYNNTTDLNNRQQQQ